MQTSTRWQRLAVTGFAVVALAALMVSAAFAAPSGETSTLDRVLARKQLVVGTAPGYFPFEMVDKTGKIIGFDIEVAQAIADALGVKLVVKQYAFDGLIPALLNGDLDMILAGMTITPKRALVVSFSNPYYRTGQVVMVSRARNPNVASWKDLDRPGKVIGVSLGTTGAMLAKRIYTRAQVRDYDTFPEAALAAASGRIDAVIYDEPAIRVYEAQHPDAVYGIYDLISVEALGIAVRKDDFPMIQWLNSFLHSYVDGPEYMAAIDRWFKKMTWIRDVEMR